MTNEELNKKITELVNRYQAGIFIGMTKDKEGLEAFCTTNGQFLEIIQAAVSIVLNTGRTDMVPTHIKNLLFQIVLNIMLSEPEYARDFFDQMALILDGNGKSEENEACKIIKMHIR